MAAEKQRDSNGRFLRSAINMADTGSVVNSVRGAIRLGRQKVSGNDPRRNSMVSGNTGLKRKG